MGLLGKLYTIDKGLLCAFVKRWYTETNSFHLPVGELTITLNDASNLLHLPIIGQFYTYPSLDVVATTDLLVDSLHVDRGVAVAETRHCRGGHVHLSWLRKVYEEACIRITCPATCVLPKLKIDIFQYLRSSGPKKCLDYWALCNLKRRLFLPTPPYLLVSPRTKYENIILSSLFSPLGFEIISLFWIT